MIGTSPFSFTGSTMTGMTIDQQGNIYIAARTQNSSSIIKVTAAGVASALTIPSNITPAISNPQGVAVDAMGNRYIVDTANSRIVEITSAGVGSVLRISGLTSPATLSSLVFGVTVDSSGNIYIPDWTNNRLVFVNVSGAALSAFATTNAGSTSTDSPKTATVTNLGNQPLVFSADPGYTPDFSQPTGSINQCLNSHFADVGYSLQCFRAVHAAIQWQPERRHYCHRQHAERCQQHATDFCQWYGNQSRRHDSRRGFHQPNQRKYRAIAYRDRCRDRHDQRAHINGPNRDSHVYGYGGFDDGIAEWR